MRFGRRRRWLALICIAASIPALGAGVLPCEPDAACALHLAREAAFRQAAAAGDDETMTAALRALHWIGEQDLATDPATSRPQFTALRTRLDGWPTVSKPLHLSSLAMAMCSAGLVPEARAIGEGNREFTSQALIYSSCTSYYARHGHLQEAFAATKWTGTPEMAESLRISVLQSAAEAGKPELVREAARLGNVDGEHVKGIIAMAHVAAGNHAAARAEVLAITDARLRESVVGLLALRYQARGPESEVGPAMRLWLAQMSKLPDSGFPLAGRSREAVTKILIERLTAAGDFAGVLAMIAELNADKRAAPLMAVAPKLLRDADIRAAEQLAKTLLRMDRELAVDALNIARVRLGTVSAAAALKSSTRPRATSNHLIQLARELGPTRMAKAREALQVAIDGDSRIGDPDWNEIIAVQLDLGLFSEAKQAMEAHQPTAADRAASLLRMSVALARRGQKQTAARYRAEALAGFRSGDRLVQEPATLALEWLNLDAIEEAEVELRSIMRRPVRAEKLRNAAELLIHKRVARGELAAALGFARVWSAHSGESSKPFMDIYAQVARVPKSW